MRRRRRYNRGGNIPYQTGAYNNPYRRGGGIKRFHAGGRPHSHRPRRMPQPIPGGPGMPPPNVDNYSMGGAMRRNSVGPYNPRRLRPAGNNLMNEQYCQPWPRCQGYTDPINDHQLTSQGYGGMCSNTWGPHCGPGLTCHQGMCIYLHKGVTVTAEREYRRGGTMRRRYGHGGGINTAAPNSCIDQHGNNVPC